MLGGYMGAKYTSRFSEGSLKLIIGIVLIVVRYYNLANILCN
jgi:uncharacterized membrane protein YfcA